MASPGGVYSIAADEVATTLAPLPVSWLPLEPSLLVKLDRLGLRTLKDIAELPATALQTRFGPAGKQARTMATGTDEATIIPRKVVESVREELRLPAPIASRDMLLLALRQLVIRAFNRPILRHRHVRQARVRISLEEGHSWEREMTFREPVGRSRERPQFVAVHALRHAVHAREAAEEVIRRAVLLDDEDHVLDRPPRVERGRVGAVRATGREEIGRLVRLRRVLARGGEEREREDRDGQPERDEHRPMLREEVPAIVG